MNRPVAARGAPEFAWREGLLHAEEVPITELAAEVGTPFYCYSSAALERRYRQFAAALAGLPATICYALKANSNQAVIRTFARLGAGADVVSEGELRRALAAGVPPEKIVFAGVGKTEAEMAAALDAGILQFNAESLPELAALARVAGQKGRRAPVALRINPDVDARTHEKISTGKAHNKFGIDIAQIPDALALLRAQPALSLQGLAVHIGSQLTDLSPYAAAFERLVQLFGELRADGFALRRLDLGGGLGVSYRDEPAPTVADYAKLVRTATAGIDAELLFEPGRFLVADAGILVTRVIYVKETPTRNFVVVDSAMNDLLRPPLYDAWHEIGPVRAGPVPAGGRPADVVGPICESSDTLARDRLLPPLGPGDLLAIFSAGAYGAVMSSTYNSRLEAPEVMVHGREHAVVRPRQTYDRLIGRDRLPDWLESPAGRSSRGAA